MAKLIEDDDRTAVKTTYEWWYVLLTGAVIGVLYVGLSAAIGHYVIDPLYCKTAINADICMNSQSISGNIATILVALLALALFIRLKVYRPIVVVIAGAILLWGLSMWTVGLGGVELVVSSAILYGLAYLSVSWICRYNNTLPVLIAVVFIVSGSRLLGMS